VSVRTALIRLIQDTAVPIDKLINILITITLFELMVAIGLSVRLAEIIGVARNLRLVTRAALANYVLVPLAVLGLLILFHPDPLVAAGFLIVAVCPGAPYAPPFTAIAKGNAPAATGLMVILAGSSAVAAPMLLYMLLPVMAGNKPLEIDASRILITLLTTQLIPLCIGILVRERSPALAERLQKPFNQLSKVLNLLVIGFILVVQFHVLSAVRPRGFAGMIALLALSLAAGWLLGGAGSAERKTMALVTSVRNVSVSLVIATGSFPGTPAVTAVLVYGIFQTVASALIAFGWGRLVRQPKPL
jgi:BASS family bile acid:Na+ symporter